MAVYNNSKCRICGTAYHRCRCKSQESWRKVTDTAGHYQIFCVIRDYVNEIIDATKAKELLSKLDLTGKENFEPEIKVVLDEIDNKTTVKKAVKTDTAKKTKKEKSDK